MPDTASPIRQAGPGVRRSSDRIRVCARRCTRPRRELAGSSVLLPPKKKEAGRPSCHPASVIGWSTQRKRRLGNRPGRQGHQCPAFVVAGDAVALEASACAAAMDDGPLAVMPDPNRDRFHGSAATGGAVTHAVIDMEAPKAPGTVVAVLASVTLRANASATVPAGKTIARSAMVHAI